MKNLLCLLLLIIALGTNKSDAQTEIYHRAKIWTGDRGLIKLSQLGIETDHGDYRKGVWFISDFSASEINRIENAGFKTDILINDVSSFYKNPALNKSSTSKQQMVVNCQAGFPVYQQPSNFNLGSYAGYFTYQEMLDNLDSMAAKYPNIITVRQGLAGGTTHENREIYFVKISDNPNIDESEPEVLYTAVHHAREPGGMSQLIYYMWYLLENYGTNAQIDAIVNNTELFFIPCVNPDGYIYNETTDPAGGGLFRKNRRNNLDGTFGVDLNRNYGYFWGFDDDGSSPNTFSETYRGDVPFSEPETQLIRDFSISRTFSAALNYHTFGNLLIYPWGYDLSIYTPDSALLSEYGDLLTTYNGYTFGTADQTVGYVVNGSSDDWMYGEQTTKNKILSMTPECGDAAQGFWPPAGEILPLCESTMFQNITLALLAGKYARLTETSPSTISNGGGYLTFNLKQLGLDTTGSYTISLTALTPNIFQTGSNVVKSNLSVLQQVTDSISYALTSPMNNGEEIRFLFSIDNGQYVSSDTITKIFGPENLVFASDGNSTIGFNAGQWGISQTIYYSPNGSITDSPNGNYGSNEFKSCRITTPLNLTNALSATLSYYARWSIEPNYDYVQIQASTNNGASWTALCGKYTVPGGLFQVFEEPLYEGHQFSWVKEEVSLNDYLGQNVQVRFVLSSDQFSEFDGFYFDDLMVTKILPGTNSINELSTVSQTISVMPNPASEYSYINLENNSFNMNLSVTNILGEIIHTEKILKGTATIKLNTTSFSKGIYFVKTECNGISSKPVKLVIQ